MKTDQININDKIQSEIIQNIAEKLRAYYVFSDIADEISNNLQKHLNNGGYKNTIDGESFANILTEHIREINQDKHLRVMWHEEPSDKTEVPMHLNKEWMERFKQENKLLNYGLHKVERLAGNIGYLDIRGFGLASLKTRHAFWFNCYLHISVVLVAIYITNMR